MELRLCDFWAIYREEEYEGELIVYGELPGGKRITAYFKPQDGPKGSWIAYKVRSGQDITPETTENTRAAQAAIRKAVDEITRLPEEIRSQWLSYLLECIDSQLGEPALNQTMQLIMKRLDRGGW
jgi:hypothetical protein